MNLIVNNSPFLPLEKKTKPLLKSFILPFFLLLIALGGGTILFFILNKQSKGIEFYKHVDEVMINPSQYDQQTLRIHGFVSDGKISESFLLEPGGGSLQLNFYLEYCDAKIPIQFQGVKPDNFKAGSEVVAFGVLRNNIFYANELNAKCPSKYKKESDPDSKRLNCEKTTFPNIK